MDRPVRDFMTQDVATIDEDADVHELEKLFLEKRIHGVPVTDKAGRLVGVVSQTDLIAWHFELGVDGTAFYEMAQLQLRGDGVHPVVTSLQEDEATLDVGELPLGDQETLRVSDIRNASVGEVMTPLVHAIRPESTAVEAAARMLRHQIHRLVVVDGDLKVQGIVCAMDLLALVPGVEEVARS